MLEHGRRQEAEPRTLEAVLPTEMPTLDSTSDDQPRTSRPMRSPKPRAHQGAVLASLGPRRGTGRIVPCLLGIARSSGRRRPAPAVRSLRVVRARRLARCSLQQARFLPETLTNPQSPWSLPSSSTAPSRRRRRRTSRQQHESARSATRTLLARGSDRSELRSRPRHPRPLHRSRNDRDTDGLLEILEPSDRASESRPRDVSLTWSRDV